MSVPTRIVISECRDALNIEYQTGTQFSLSAEYLRVFSPSAEVRGHGKGQELLQFGKRDVLIDAVQQSGNYAIQITFNDGHDSGIFTWDYLLQLSNNHQQNWNDYLQKLHEAGKCRETDRQVVKLL